MFYLLCEAVLLNSLRKRIKMFLEFTNAKKTYVNLKLLFVFAVLIGCLTNRASAQLPVELSCPTGASPLSNGISYDPVTHSNRYFLCINPLNGTVTFNDAVTSGGATFPLLAPNGSVTAPSYSFSGSSNSGMYFSSSAVIFAAAGVGTFATNGTVDAIPGTIPLDFNSSAVGSAIDTGISRSAAGVIAVGSGAQGSTVGSVLAANIVPVSVSSTYTNATTGPTNVTGLSIALLSGQTYQITCNLVYQGSAATAGIAINATGPTASLVVINAIISTTTSGGATFSTGTHTTGTYPGITPVGTVVSTGADLTAVVEYSIVTTAAGTFQLQAAAAGTGTLTIQAGSSCHP
jgi:hypothetical protein